MEVFGSLTIVCGLKVTVLCGFGGLEVEDVGGCRRGDLSVETEAIARMKMAVSEVIYMHEYEEIIIIFLISFSLLSIFFDDC